MSIPSTEALQHYLRRLCDEAVPPDDAVLLDRFVAAQDREAFELLIARHGPMVLGTAQRLVENLHDAEDVFQAVFLSLARLAKTIRQGCTLPAWLHKVTCRIAAKVRKHRVAAARQPWPEPCQANLLPEAQLVWQEVCQALDEELQHLPQQLRSPLLLCYLAGLSRDEAARQLGWSLGTLKRRLEEGRNTLRIRLHRRGVAAVGLAVNVLAPQALQTAVRRSLVESCLNIIFSSAEVVPTTISALVLGSTTMKGLAMKSTLALLAVVALGAGIYAAMGQADPPPPAREKKGKPTQQAKAGPLDDPLPAGSTLRFGTSRFRHGIPVSTLAVSADGKIAVAVNGNHVLGATRVFDLVSGRTLYTLGGWEGMDIEAAAVSPDGRTIVTKQDFSLRVRDAATGKELRKIALLRVPPNTAYSRNEWVSFTPDGKAIAVTSQGKDIHLIDFASGTTIRNFVHDNPESILSGGFDTVLGIAISADGKRLASGGYNNDKGDYFARLWDVETGKELRRFMHGKRSYGISRLAFSPDGKTLATGSQDAQLRLFDVASGKQRKVFPGNGSGRVLSVAFSPDGKTVAAAGASIQLFDATTFKERLRIERPAGNLQFTDDGKTLTGSVMGAIYRWDAATGKTLTPQAGDSIVEQILVTSDGRRVVTRGQNGDAHLWDAATGKHLRAVVAAWQRGLALSPDGRYLVWPVADPSVRFVDPATPNVTHEGSRIRLYDVAADKRVDRFAGFKGEADELTFIDAGKKLLTVDHRDGMVRLWNVETGKEERGFKAVPQANKNLPASVWRTTPSADGRVLAVSYHPMAAARGRLGFTAGSPVRLWDVSTGKELQQLNGHTHYVVGMAFSPDGRLLATAGENNPVLVWDTATGKRVAPLPEGLPVGASAVAFSPDGRFLATGLTKGAIQIWEVATWTKRNEFPGHRDRPTCLSFTPAGQLLSGSLDTTVLAWDMQPPRVAAPTSLPGAWSNLAAKDAGKSFQSESKFLTTPRETVKLFAEKFKPPVALDRQRIRRWLADLGSDKFAVREAASKALSKLDEQARPYLEEALKSSESAEVRLRVKRLLEQSQGATLSSEQIRQVRAVMVLERIGEGESKDLLKKWAAGPAGALLTVEAAQALRRLEAAPKTTR